MPHDNKACQQKRECCVGPGVVPVDIRQGCTVTVRVKISKTVMNAQAPKLNQQSSSDLNYCEAESAWPIHGAHDAERKGQRPEPAADDVPSRPFAKRLARVRWT